MRISPRILTIYIITCILIVFGFLSTVIVVSGLYHVEVEVDKYTPRECVYIVFRNYTVVEIDSIHMVLSNKSGVVALIHNNGSVMYINENYSRLMNAYINCTNEKTMKTIHPAVVFMLLLSASMPLGMRVGVWVFEKMYRIEELRYGNPSLYVDIKMHASDLMGMIVINSFSTLLIALGILLFTF